MLLYKLAFLIPKTSSHFFCIRLRNREYSRRQLPTKIEKLEAGPSSRKLLVYFFLHSTVHFYIFKKIHPLILCLFIALKNASLLKSNV
jgi:hypothetical protein